MQLCFSRESFSGLGKDGNVRVFFHALSFLRCFDMIGWMTERMFVQPTVTVSF